MKTIFVKTRSELTGQMKELIKQGLTCYRVRVGCTCRPPLKNPEMYPRANQQHGVLVIDRNTVKMLLIKCKDCAPETETKE
jgi:hypothetical protein